MQPFRPMTPAMRAGAVAVVVAIIVWVAIGAGGRDEGPGARPSVVGSAQPAGVATAISADGLREYARAHPTPVYWAGPKKSSTLEFGAPKRGTTLVRYLPPGRPVGDKVARLLIATYELDDPLAAIKRAGLKQGAQTRLLPRGGYAVFDTGEASSVYFAFPNSKVQVQVFHPKAGRALALVLSGEVIPVVAKSGG